MRKEVLLLGLLFVGAVFWADEGITIDKQHFNASTQGGVTSVVLTGEHYSTIVPLGGCRVKDAYRFCLHSVEQDRVEFWPHEYRINMTWVKSDYLHVGAACQSDSECASRACVHDVCRPERPWCGDGICDPFETCPADCPEQRPAEPSNVTEIPVPVNASEEVNATEEVPVEAEPLEPEELLESEESLEPEELSARPSVPVSAERDVNRTGAFLTLAVGGLLLVLLLMSRKPRHRI